MKILVITSRIPWPLEKGDKLRIYHQLKTLGRTNEIILCALQDQAIPEGAEAELKKFCRSIHFFRFGKIALFFHLLRGLFNGWPLQVAWFYHPKAARQIHDLIAREKPDCIYCQLIRTAEYVRTIRDVPKVLDYMDVFSKGVDRRLPKISPLLRPVFRLEYKRLLRYEAAVFDDFDERTIISEQDRALIPHPQRDKIGIVPNGVDTEFFQPKNIEKKFELLFNGNMSYPPNVESVEYLVREVLPLVHRTRPDVRLLISGATPAQRVLALKSDHVIVSGWVDDVRDSFASAKMLVAPMQSSIGLQNKLLEAMAMRLPCITSRLSNNAIGAEDGKEILVADSPEAYAQHILHLLDHPDAAAQLADNALVFVKEKFDWVAMNARLEALLHHAQAKK